MNYLNNPWVIGWLVLGLVVAALGQNADHYSRGIRVGAWRMADLSGLARERKSYRLKPILVVAPS
jgi:hypothetical protein